MLDDIGEVFLVTYLAHSDIDGDRDLVARSDQPLLKGIRERAVIEVQGECHGLIHVPAVAVSFFQGGFRDSFSGCVYETPPRQEEILVFRLGGE